MTRTLFLEKKKLNSKRLSSVSVTGPESWEAFRASGVQSFSESWFLPGLIQKLPSVWQSSSPSLEGSSNAPVTPKWNVCVASAELTLFWRILASWAYTPTLGSHESSRGPRHPNTWHRDSLTKTLALYSQPDPADATRGGEEFQSWPNSTPGKSLLESFPW